MQYNITYRQKDKGWQYIISYKDKSQWKQKSKQGFDTKKKASLDAAERVKEIEKQLDLEDSLDANQVDITFLAFAKQLIEHERLYKEVNTIVTYNKALDKFKDVHDVSLKDLKHMHVQRCVDKMGEEGLKISTIRQHVNKINYMLNQAVEPNKIMLNNPIGKIKYPSETLEEQTAQIKALTRTEIESFLSELKKRNTNAYFFCLVAVTTGLRSGELLGLTWADIDFQNATLTVNKQWKVLKNGETSFGKLKRKNSYRTIPVPKHMLQELTGYRKQSTLIEINNRVFPFTATYNISLQQLFARMHWDISVHTLRHTYATNLIANGVDFKTAAQLLGHDVDMTIKKYSHVTSDMLKSAAEKINKIF